MNFHNIPKLSNAYLHPFLHLNTIKTLLKHRSSTNAKTVDTYNREYMTYIKNTPSQYPISYQSMLSWFEESLRYTKTQGKVLEIGSATSRDANFMRSRGYTVQTSDAAPNFVANMNRNGDSAIMLNILEDKIQGKYDMVFANAVFPHFTDEDIYIALKNIYDGLDENGIVSFNVKQGNREDWINEKSISKRYINYQQPDNIKHIVEQSHFEIVSFKNGIPGDPPTHIWTRIIARKIS